LQNTLLLGLLFTFRTTVLDAAVTDPVRAVAVFEFVSVTTEVSVASAVETMEFSFALLYSSFCLWV